MINIFTRCHLYSLGEKGRPFSAAKLRVRAPRLSGKGPAPRWLCQKPPGAVRRDPPAPATDGRGEGEKCGNFLDSGEKHICEHVYICIICIYIYITYMYLFIYVFIYFIYFFIYLFIQNYIYIYLVI